MRHDRWLLRWAHSRTQHDAKLGLVVEKLAELVALTIWRRPLRRRLAPSNGSTVAWSIKPRSSTCTHWSTEFW